MTKQKRMEQKWIHEQESAAESAKFDSAVQEPVVDPEVASQEAYHKLMTGADAPEWARVTVNESLVAAPATAEAIEAKIAALEAEQAKTLAHLNKVQEEQREVLNAKLAQRRAAEEAEAAAATSQMPDQMKAALAEVKKYVAGPEAAVAAPVVVDWVQRGRDALDRAQRRLRGEIVPEPIFDDPAPVPQTLTQHQDALRARVAPHLAAAEQTKVALDKWFDDYSKTFAALHVSPDHDYEYRDMVDNLMAGLPATTSILQSQSLGLVTGLLRGVRKGLELANSMRGTLDRESREIEALISRVGAFGPMTSQGDNSSGYYKFERQLVPALHRLGTVNSDSITALDTITRAVGGALERITTARAEYAGQPQPVLTWESKGAVLADIAAAKRVTHGRPESGEPWSVFAKEAS